ncbi:hypothetical protein HJG60_009394 [Phyllostomus discolor]|uniref:Uncharacterized protein n=1 Tax=Phyllostomus discolor TaxID=89673 RepID=A0A833YJ15_9CHIR|nr:hypothetical protein HJG60_009394 [Phyllostomus discolor]
MTCRSPIHRILFLQRVFTRLGSGLDPAKEMGGDEANATLEPELSRLSRGHSDALFLGREPGTELLWPFSRNEQSPTLPSLLSKGQRPGRQHLPGHCPVHTPNSADLTKDIGQIKQTPLALVFREIWVGFPFCFFCFLHT